MVEPPAPDCTGGFGWLVGGDFQSPPTRTLRVRPGRTLARSARRGAPPRRPPRRSAPVSLPPPAPPPPAARPAAPPPVPPAPALRRRWWVPEPAPRPL